MVKQCNIHGQSVQLINYGQVWCQYWNAIQMLIYNYDSTSGTKLDHSLLATHFDHIYCTV